MDKLASERGRVFYTQNPAMPGIPACAGVLCGRKSGRLVWRANFLETPRASGDLTLQTRLDHRATNTTLRRTTTNPFVASEGYPFLIGAALLVMVAGRYFGWLEAIPPLLLFGYFFLLFRDPERPVPAVPLGVVSPVDGVVLDVGLTEHSMLGAEAQVISIRVNSLGTYTARSPVEGKVLDFATDGPAEPQTTGNGGLWLRTDEGDDVVLRFREHRFGLVPKAFARYGERVGQGQRCAFLRLTAVAEVQVPVVARLQVEAGQSVTAGSDVLARLPSH